jgi:hypothetical protein
MSELIKRLTTGKALLIAALVGAFVYMFMPSCLAFVPDEDDTLCHAIAAAEDGKVEWPAYERQWWMNEDARVFDNVWMSPWWFSEEARHYIEGYGLAQGHEWGELGRDDVMAYDDKTVLTPLGRTYNGYANIIYANPEGIELDRGRSLTDFTYYDTFLKWASAYVYTNTYRVNGNCARSCLNVTSDWCEIAKTVTGTFRNDYITLFQSFFYDIDAVLRASTIVHEVRHARNGVMHAGGNGCARHASCDERWSTRGANTFEMMWLAAYYYTPENHSFITRARRERAKVYFNTLRHGAFLDPVQWNLMHFYAINETPEYYVNEVACSEDPDRPHRCLYLAN